MLSAANFLVGLILIRYTHDTQYGYYVLGFNAMMLAVTLQGSFIGTPLIIRLPTLTEAQRSAWVGSLLRDQIRWSMFGGVATLAGAAIAWAMGALDRESAPVLVAGLVLVLCQLYREYFRSVLLMVQRTVPVLAADSVYVACLIVGGLAATRFAAAATAALLAAAAAALVGAELLRRILGPGLDRQAAPGRLADIARTGAWAAAGGVIYWLFTQGYSFVAAATLDIAGVAALAASRLLMMPINVMSTGVQKQLVPIASGWVHQSGVAHTFRRLLIFSCIMGVLTLVYGAVVWLLRDWIFVDLMRKSFDYRNTLLLMWIGVFLVMVMREPITQLLVLRQRFRTLMAASLASAVVALTISYLGMTQFGTRGAPIGILVGEVLNLIAALWMVRREIRIDRRDAGAGNTHD
ncbi:capsular biosynthesis protein [Achromobacter aloeverae]|uniref:Capsular biosynthesis protein n=2 Tax=Achromobacter aloeverae TaxID=1750518 RepID=A0A4Q1HHZ9_9BURK|nr:capsular biosynthesis protein [Achromobacter aloeverae]